MTWYYRRLDNGLVVMHTRPEHAEELEELQRVCSRRSPTTSASRRGTTASTSSSSPRASSSRSTATASSAPRRRSGCTSTSITSTTRSPRSSRAAGSPRTSRTATGSTAPTSACTPTIAAAASPRRSTPRARNWCGGSACSGQVTGGMLSGYGAVKDTMSAEDYYADVVAGRHQGPDALDAARRRLRAAGAAQGLPERSGLGQLQRAASCSTPPRTCPARRARWRGATCACTTPVPGPRAKAMLERRAAALPTGLGQATEVVVERADGALHRRRRRQHVHRLRRRHRRRRRRATRPRRSSTPSPRRRRSSSTPARSSPPTSRSCGCPSC